MSDYLDEPRATTTSSSGFEASTKPKRISISVKELARMKSVSLNTAYQWIAAGCLPAEYRVERFGRTIRIVLLDD